MANVVNFSETDKRFILFPLSALKIFVSDSDGLNIILDYGIKRLGDTIPEKDIDDDEMIMEAVEEYNRGGNILTEELVDMLLGHKEKYGNFDNINLLEPGRKKCLRWYRVRLAQKKLRMKGDVNSIIYRANRISEKPNEPVIMASVDFILKARDEIKPNEKQRMALALLFGLNSIIGMRRTWAATTQDMIKARMFGYLTPKREGKSYENKQTKEVFV